MSSDDTRPLTDDLGFERRPEDTAALRGADTTVVRTDDATARPHGDPPVYRRGPAPFGLVLGVVGLAVALVVVLTELADVDVPWSDLGPWVVVAGGLLVVLVGLLGLRSSRTDD